MLALFNESIAEAIDNSCIYPPDKMFALSSKFIYCQIDFAGYNCRVKLLLVEVAVKCGVIP